MCYEYNLLLFVPDFVFYNVISVLYIAILYMYMILVDYIYKYMCNIKCIVLFTCIINKTVQRYLCAVSPPLRAPLPMVFPS